jgi:hypothetical protein
MSDEPLPKPSYLGEPIGYKVLCPHCNQTHDVNPYLSPPQPTMTEPENTRQWVTCPPSGKDYLVGIGGYLFLMQDPPFTPVENG